MAKRYFWLKLQEDFFTQNLAIKKLRRLAGGDTYTIILLKMYLISLKNEGKIIYEGIEDTLAEEIASQIDEEIENVSVTLTFMQRHKMIEIMSDNEFVLPYVLENTGSESESAERVRAFREKQKQLALQCNEDVTESNAPVTACNTEKRREEKEKELESEKEYNVEQDSTTHIPCEEIISYLNQKANTNYKISSKKTQACIKARINEGFTLEDFKTVIDKKCKEWIGTEWEKFLRPETLFGTKFESYLNANINQPSKQTSLTKSAQGYLGYEQRSYSAEEWENMEQSLLNK